MSNNNDSQTNQEQQDTKKLAADVHWITHATFWSQIGLGVIGIVALVIYHGQLGVMSDQLKQMKQDAQGSSAQFQTQLRHFDASLGISQYQTAQTTRLAVATEQANANVVESDRPWIGGEIKVTTFEVGKPPLFKIIFVNSGKRPAIEDSSDVAQGVQTSFPGDPDRVLDDLPVRHSSSFIVPGAFYVVNSSAHVLSQEVMDALRSHQKNFYVIGRIFYRDARTKKRYWTHICSYFDPENISPEDDGFHSCSSYTDAR